MRLSTIMVLMTAASSAIAATGLWGFYRSFDPIPSSLNSFSGTATEVRTSARLYSKSHATFRLIQTNGSSTEFSYTPKFKRFYYFAEHLKDGKHVEVTIGPDGIHDFWGLKLEAETLMSPAGARDARITDGRWGLALFVGFVASAIWSARAVPTFRRKGI